MTVEIPRPSELLQQGRFAVLATGQGSFGDKGKYLYENSSAAREILETAKTVIGKLPHELTDEKSRELAQPIIVAVSLAAHAAYVEGHPSFSILQSVGLVGHSLGELTVARLAGVIADDETAIQIAKLRGQHMQKVRGGMAVINGSSDLDEEQIWTLCKENGVYIAGFNGPGQITISGTEGLVQHAIEQMSIQLKPKARVRMLSGIIIPSHSPLMQPAMAAFAKDLERFNFHDATNPIIMGFNGLPEINGEAIKAGLLQGMVNPVRFHQAIQLLRLYTNRLIEFGQADTLTKLARRIDPSLRAEFYEESDLE